MSTPGATNLVIRVAVADAASAPIAKINESLAATGSAAAAGSARTVAALGQTDVALAGTAAKAAALGEANTAAATASAGAWTRASAAIATSSTAAGTAAVATASKFAAATELMKPLLGIVAAFGAIHFLGGSVEAGKDDLLGIRMVKQEFGAASQEVLEFGENAAQAFGLSAAAADKLTSQFGQYLTALKLGSASEFPEMSMELTKVTADIAKFNGVSIETASSAVESGIAGRTKALKALGIGIDDVSKRQAAMDHHIGDGTGDLSKLNTAQDNMAKYYAVIDGATRQIGAQDKANGSLSKSQAQVSASLENLQGEIGQGLVPVLAASASLINTTVIPAFSAVFHAIGPLFSLYKILPTPIQATTAALLVMVALRGPLTTMLTALSDRLYLAAASFGATGLAGATSTGLLGLSKFAGFMAGPWGLAITGGIILLTTFFKNSDQAAKSQLTFGEVIDDGTGKLKDNTAAMLDNQIAKTGVGDQLSLLGSNVQDYSKALAGSQPEQEAYAKRINDQSVAAANWNLQSGEGSGLLSRHTDEYNKNAQIMDAADKVLKQFATDTSSLADEQRHATQAVGETEEAHLDLMDAQDKDKASAVYLQTQLADMTVTTLPAVTEKVNTLRLGWANMDDQVTTVIANLDKLAGRDAPVEQALGNMYKALQDQADKFKVGQQGAVLLDPKRLLNGDGTINQHSAAGRDLYGTLTSDQTGIVTAATAAYDQTYAKTHDLTAAREAANKVTDEGYKLEEKNLTAILGSKKAADDLMTTYGHLSGTTTMTIIANTNQADAALAATGQKVAGVTGAPNPATLPPTVPAAPSQNGNVPAPNLGGSLPPGHDGNYGGSGGTAGGGSGPFGQGTGGTPGATPGSSLPPGHDGNSAKAVGAHAGQKWAPVVEKWRATALQALALSGEPQSEIDEVLYRINLESTGNAHAINNPKGTGGANGLVQLMFPTWNQYKVPGYDTDIYDGLSNLLAGMNYSKHQYGSVVAGFDRPGWYDEGGWLMPGGLARSQMSTPEPILTPAQWKVAEAAINHRIDAVDGGGGTTVGPIYITVEGDPDDMQIERLRDKVTAMFEQTIRRR